MNDNQYNYIKEVVQNRLTNIRKTLIHAINKYDMDESVNMHTLVDIISDIMIEIREIKDFMDEF